MKDGGGGGDGGVCVYVCLYARMCTCVCVSARACCLFSCVRVNVNGCI